MTVVYRQPPAVVRTINRWLRPPVLDPSKLLETYGLGDNHRLAEAARVLCDALSQGQVHAFGLTYARALIAGSLRERKMVDSYLQIHPEILDVPLRLPLVVLGLQRSGTTFLHRLLAARSDARGLKLWELMRPAPPKGLDTRHLSTALIFHAFRQVAHPDLDVMHFMRPDLADECQFLFRLDLRSPVLWTAFAGLTYARWLFSQDMAESCQLYRAILCILQSQSPARRLVLKNPGHSLYPEALLKALPEARLVCIHRDPQQTLASQCRLTRIAQSAMTTNVDESAVTSTVVQMQRHMAERLLAIADHPRVLHVRYQDLVTEPVAMARRVYDYAGWPWSEDVAAKVDAHRGENRQYAHGRYRCHPDDFGLDNADTHTVFREYTARFLERSP